MLVVKGFGHSDFDAIPRILFYLLRRNRFFNSAACITSNADADYKIFKSGDGYMCLSRSHAEESTASIDLQEFPQ